MTTASSRLGIVLAVTAVCAFSAPARAISGIVRGFVTYIDVRQESSDAAGSRRGTGFGETRLAGARVRVLGGGGGTIGESVTDSNGEYVVSYDDPFAFGYPTSGWKLRITLEDVNDFSVRTSGGTLYGHDTNIVLPNSDHTLAEVALGDSDELQVFATTHEYWRVTCPNS